jgi:holo-[acyl-carrier protein] synthase
MNIIGIGTDIIQVERVRKTLTRHPEHFPERHFTVSERAYCDAYNDPSERYAGRFAAKEAVSKALGTGFGEHLAFLDIDIQNDPAGKPFVILSENAKRHFGDVKFHLSISHCKEYAVAMVVAVASN